MNLEEIVAYVTGQAGVNGMFVTTVDGGRILHRQISPAYADETLLALAGSGLRLHRVMESKLPSTQQVLSRSSLIDLLIQKQADHACFVAFTHGASSKLLRLALANVGPSLNEALAPLIAKPQAIPESDSSATGVAPTSSKRLFQRKTAPKDSDKGIWG